MAVDDDGNVYLSLMNQDKVQVYDESGKLLREWGKRGAGDGEFRQPGGIVLAPGGTVYVADQGNHRVQMFDTEGKFRGKWGEHGSGPGQFGGNEPKGSRFGGPHFLARDSQGPALHHRRDDRPGAAVLRRGEAAACLGRQGQTNPAGSAP